MGHLSEALVTKGPCAGGEPPAAPAQTPHTTELLLTGCSDHRQLSSLGTECEGHPMTGEQEWGREGQVWHIFKSGKNPCCAALGLCCPAPQ